MKKILLIDDNDETRSNMAEILKLSNYKVIEAENGKIGVQKAMENHPDLIICDILMPILDGYGVLQKNEIIKNIPFIFLTAKTERKGMELVADDYITKPFNRVELLNAVDNRFKKLELLKQKLTPDLEGLHHLLKATGKEALLSFTEGRNIKKYKKRQIIYLDGNSPNRLFYVLKGKVKAYKTNEYSKGLTTELFSTGDFLGHIALLEGTAYKDTAEALEETELAIIPKEDFEELINKNAEVARKLIQLLAKNISEKEEQLLRLAYNSVREKVADALLTLQKKYQGEEEKFVIDLSRENLAAIAGTSTESTVRTLSDFRSEHLIDIKADKSIAIINQKKLELMLN